MNDRIEGVIPPWLDAMIDQRLAKLSEAGVFRSPAVAIANIVMTSLTEPLDYDEPQVRAAWERTCDGCGTYCQPDDDFFTGSATKERDRGDGSKLQVVITFGFCGECTATRF